MIVGYMKRKQSKQLTAASENKPAPRYDNILAGMVDLLENARRASARAVNSIITATYWEIGRRIVEVEQVNRRQKDYYGDFIVEELSKDLSARFGRGYGRRNLFQMRAFYLAYSKKVQTPSALSLTVVGAEKVQTPSEKFSHNQKSETLSRIFSLDDIAKRFPLSWSHYVALLGVNDEKGREFYESEALRGGWSVRQLNRQIGTQFYQRTLLSKNKAAMLTKGAEALPEDAVTAEEEIKSPFVLEFLGLKDDYSESQLEEALIKHLQAFLLELGGDFTFVDRQRKLRIDDEWYKIDLLFYHRRLRCLVVIDLKLNKMTPGDVGQMHVYCNYAKHHWTRPEENPPIGLILCAGKGINLAHYALEGLPNKIMAADYLTALPDKNLLEEELAKTRRMLEAHREEITASKPKEGARKKSPAKKKSAKAKSKP